MFYFLKYFISKRTALSFFSYEKTLSKVNLHIFSHDIIVIYDYHKGTSTMARLSLIAKILITESGARLSSNWAKRLTDFLGEKSKLANVLTANHLYDDKFLFLSKKMKSILETGVHLNFIKK